MNRYTSYTGSLNASNVFENIHFENINVILGYIPEDYEIFSITVFGKYNNLVLVIIKKIEPWINNKS